jgi:hypothetical protein
MYPDFPHAGVIIEFWHGVEEKVHSYYTGGGSPNSAMQGIIATRGGRQENLRRVADAYDRPGWKLQHDRLRRKAA